MKVRINSYFLWKLVQHALLKMMYISEIDKDRQWAGKVLRTGEAA